MKLANALTIVAVGALATGCGDDGGGGQNTMPPDLDMVSDDVPPVDSDDLFAYMKAGMYTDMLAEPTIHPSSPAHGMARVFLNRQLAQSLLDGNAEHPVGAASIKEIYQQDGETLRGYSAEVKVAAGADGDTWYWYEILNVENNDNPIADGIGESLCVNCHAGGTDFVLIPKSNFGL